MTNFTCKSGKHTWLRQEDAAKCCNGYRRILVLGDQPPNSRNIQTVAGVQAGRVWMKEKQILVVTDGSAIQHGAHGGPAGWAACVEYEFYQGQIEFASNNEAEIIAIREALSRVEPNLSVVVQTDSKVAIGWLNNGTCNSAEARRIRNEIRDLIASKRLDVIYRYISSSSIHSQVHQMARASARLARINQAEPTLLARKTLVPIDKTDKS